MQFWIPDDLQNMYIKLISNPMIFTYSWNISSEDEDLDNFDPTRLF